MPIVKLNEVIEKIKRLKELFDDGTISEGEFNDIKKDNKSEVVTYEVFDSDSRSADYNNPILIIDNNKRQWAHHSNGMFQSPLKGSGFEFRVDDTIEIADIIKIDSRFVNLIKWLGENHIQVTTSTREPALMAAYTPGMPLLLALTQTLVTLLTTSALKAGDCRLGEAIARFKNWATRIH